MAATSSGRAFASASSAMVRGVDVASTVHVLLADCIHLLDADSAGVLVRLRDDELELLAASSHRATDLELYQSQARTGPCFDVVTTGRTIASDNADDLARRWPDFATVMAEAGLQAVHSAPLRWHGHVIGGFNLFWKAPTELSSENRNTAQAFADICTLAITQTPHADDQQRLADHVRTALQGRVVIERAKGVLAELEGLDMAAAFDRLVQRSEQEGVPLTIAAIRTTGEAYS